ncbi:MAG: four helix bundle protein [Planctomycetota bacterium]|nr:four helix bundle protein [Planctomycetota bacterium]
MAFAFEKLIVYQKSVDFADVICQATEQFLRGYGFLSDQLNRAALSISANLAEGNGPFTRPDRRNFFGIAGGSIQECIPLLELARRRGLLDETRHSALKAQLEEIARMLAGLINGLYKPEPHRHFADHLFLGWSPQGLGPDHGSRQRDPPRLPWQAHSVRSGMGFPESLRVWRRVRSRGYTGAVKALESRVLSRSGS